MSVPVGDLVGGCLSWWESGWVFELVRDRVGGVRAGERPGGWVSGGMAGGWVSGQLFV